MSVGIEAEIATRRRRIALRFLSSSSETALAQTQPQTQTQTQTQTQPLRRVALIRHPAMAQCYLPLRYI